MGSELVVVADPVLAAPAPSVMLAEVAAAEVVAAAESRSVVLVEVNCPEASWSKATSAKTTGLIVAGGSD